MTEIKLRDYQSSAVSDTVKALVKSERKRVICEMPTGGGKTVVFSYIVQQANKKGSKTLILTDRDELLRGTGGTLENFGVKPEYIKAGRKFAPAVASGAAAFVGMAQTLKNRLDKEDWKAWFKSLDLIIIDEVHKQEFNKFFELDVFFNATVIGFSATPKRGGKQRQLGADFDEIVHTLTIPELIDMGFLMPDMYFGFSDFAPDLKGVKKNSKGDYSESDLFAKYDKPKLYGGVIEAWKQHTPNTITIVFCTNIIHCVRTCKQFEDAGISARFISSKMSKPNRPKGDEPIDKANAGAEWVKYWERDKYYNEYIQAYPIYSGPREKLINDWKAGDFKVMINAGILTTGFDFPAIQTVVLFRATISEVLYLQMLGRGSRISPETGKVCFNILDFGRNAERLGGYKMPRHWQLFHNSKAGAGVPPVKECGVVQNVKKKDENGNEGCGDFILAAAKICPNCGYVFPKQKDPEAAKLELMYTDKNGKLRATKPINNMSFEELTLFAKENKYKPAWINIQVYRRGGLEELKKYAKFKNYSPGWVTIANSRIPANVKEEVNILTPQTA